MYWQLESVATTLKCGEISSSGCEAFVEFVQSDADLIPRHWPTAWKSLVNRSFRCTRLIPLLLAVTAGCPQSENSGPKGGLLPFSGQEIRIGVPAGMGLQAAWEGPLNEWASQTGAKYSLTEIAAAPGSGRSAPFFDAATDTLAIFPLNLAGEIVAAGDLAPIPMQVLEASDDAFSWRDLFAGLREKLATNKGRPMFVPLSAPVLVCYYRQDLLKAADLAPPQTWDDYQRLVDRLDQWAPGLTAVEPWSESFRPTMFLARGVSLAQHPAHYSLFFDIETGSPLIDSPAFVRALEAAQSAVRKMPAEVLQFGPADCRREILRGRAALAIAFEQPIARGTAESHMSDAEMNGRAGGISLGFVQLPGSREVYDADRRLWESAPEKGVNRVTLTGFAGWAVGCSARQSQLQIEAGWNALTQVCGPRISGGLPSEMFGLCRESQVTAASGYFGNEFDGEQAAAYAGAVAQSLRSDRIVAELPVAGRSEFRDALSRALGAALGNSQSPDEALKAAATDWQATVNRIGKDRFRDNYRASLGLSPKPRRN